MEDKIKKELDRMVIRIQTLEERLVEVHDKLEDLEVKSPFQGH